jgi:hypothetical protein
MTAAYKVQINEYTYRERKLWLSSSVAKFIVPDWRDIVDSGMGCHTDLPTNVRQPNAGVNFIPPVRDYEFCFSLIVT